MGDVKLVKEKHSITPEDKPWPSLELDRWQDTCETLKLWTQIVGKVRLVQMPWTNHSWHVPLYVTARGLSTSVIPHGTQIFQLEFDFIAHKLVLETANGDRRTLPLKPQTVAEFYESVMTTLTELGLPVDINEIPNEIADATPFSEDNNHAAYDAAYAQRFWHVLLQADRVFRSFRASFIGKVSPVHFFWGGFDLAVTRFSGRPAPQHPGGVPNLPDWVVREAYSHEVSSAGFWPGGGPHPFPLFYSYAYPEPPGFADAVNLPDGAFYSRDLGEFVLPYETVRTSVSPDQTLLAFLQGTYQAAAELGNWNRRALETYRFSP